MLSPPVTQAQSPSKSAKGNSVYLEFDRYKELGGKLAQGLFMRAEFSARMKIDALTHNRLESVPADSPVWEKVRMLILELVERQLIGMGGKELKSINNDGQSRTYESVEGKADELIRQFLGNEKTPDGVWLINPGGVMFGSAVRS